MANLDLSLADHPSRRPGVELDAEREVSRALARLVGFDPDVLDAVNVLRQVAAAARARYRVAVLEARAVGYAWDAIGDGPGLRPAVAARAFVDVLEPGQDHLEWTCAECDALVEDHGPRASAEDAERGHVKGCARFALLTATYRRRRMLDDAGRR